MLDPRIVLVIAGILLLTLGVMGEAIAARRDRKVPTTATPTTATPTSVPLDVVAHPTQEAVEGRHRREAEAQRRRFEAEARLDAWNDRVRRARRKPIHMGWAIDGGWVWREDAPWVGAIVTVGLQRDCLDWHGEGVRVETPEGCPIGWVDDNSARPTASKRLTVYIGGAHLMYSIGRDVAKKGGIWWENDASRLRPTRS